MKCTALALLASGAYAVQDIAPPVISLDLASYTGVAAGNPGVTGTTHLASSTHEGETYEHQLHAGKATSAHASSSCAVNYCDDWAAGPTCNAKDHHDHNVECRTTIELVNNNGDPASHVQDTYNEANVAIRSMWLFHYNAQDDSGNQAEEVTFELTVYDHEDPVLTSLGTYFSTGARVSEQESCVEGDSDFKSSGAHPCTKTIGQADASDNIDTEAHMQGDIRYERVHKSGYQATAELAVSDYSQPAVSAMTKKWADLSPQTMDTHSLGRYHFTWYVCDTAGQFGKNGANNCIWDTKTVQIVDTTKPVIDLKNVGTKGDYCNGGCDADQYECGRDTFTEQDAWCKDLHDSFDGTETDGSYKWVHKDATVDNTDVTRDINDKVKTVKTATITYNCDDTSANPSPNAADQVTRTLTIVDTTNPTCTITGDNTIENSAGKALVDATANPGSGNSYENGTGLNHDLMADGFTCTDACNDIGTIAITKTAVLYYGKDCAENGGTKVGNGDVSEFPEYTAGAYSVLYTCTDNASLTDTKCRVIENVDHTEPIIQVLGSDHMTLEATHEGNYIDDGATCSDQVDGVISQNVEVSGDVVNLSKVGAYTITYNCKDSAGNSAPTLDRKVHVKQTSCPTCDLGTATTAGDVSITHEASFPYTDATVTCTDVIDGDITPVFQVWKDGAEVTPNAVNIDTIGTYKITYRAQNSVGLWNDGKADDGTTSSDETKCRGSDISYVRTVEVKDTLQPVIQLRDSSGAILASGSTAGTSETSNVALGNNDKSAEDREIKPTTDLNYPLMAESATTSSVNGWVIGAVASAVTGLALLGYSQRKTTVATSVPV